ncbi:MAG TPA: hypothetical protein VLI89_04705 [Burkholderiales bacterium]|nr:hypothetical protein [Burkholderiales bacterium]
MRLRDILVSLAAQHSKDARINAIANITLRLQALPADLVQQVAVGATTLTRAEELARNRR